MIIVCATYPPQNLGPRYPSMGTWQSVKTQIKCRMFVVYSYGLLFYYTKVGQASDSMTDGLAKSFHPLVTLMFEFGWAILAQLEVSLAQTICES